MEDILYNLGREKEYLDKLFEEIKNCKEMIVPIDSDYVRI